MSETLIAWAILLGGFVAPLLHVAFSPRSGPWGPPPGTRCPLGPRPGWLVMVLRLGPIGWLLYLSARRRRKDGRSGTPDSGPPRAGTERGPPASS